MNSYFGWNYNTAATFDGGVRHYGEGRLKFMYEKKPESRYHSADRVLLFAEMPYVDLEKTGEGPQSASWDTGASEENDMVLQYESGDGEAADANKAAKSGGEAIGFNHKAGKNYCAHVAFADGHCDRIALLRSATAEDLKKLTRWLCTGQEHAISGGNYVKAEDIK